MKPLRLIRTTAASIAILLLLLAARSNADERPNIVLIMADDMGFSDIGCYGGEINTRHIDQLAEDGLRFTQFYNTGRCCPTRASLMTVTLNGEDAEAWELYDISHVRTETENVAVEHPDRVAQMKSEWTDWATQANILPWPKDRKTP